MSITRERGWLPRAVERTGNDKGYLSRIRRGLAKPSAELATQLMEVWPGFGADIARRWPDLPPRIAEVLGEPVEVLFPELAGQEGE